MKTISDKIKNAFATLKGEFGLTSVMQSPRISKIVLSVGVGALAAKDKKKAELVADRLAKITGQKASHRPAKKSIASFKSRQGDLSGYQVTLRGPRMNQFLERLINVALPRTKDFRGLSDKGIDEMGNYTLGIKEHTIFPETADEDIKDVFGLAVTIVTTSRDPKLTKAFLSHIGFPFKK